MPKGFASVKQAAANFFGDDEEKGPSVLWLKLEDDGDSAVVRALEQGDETFYYFFHDFSHVDGKHGWKTKLPCLDQDSEGVPCPGCQEDLPRKFQGLINVIWRDAPVYERDEEGIFVRTNNKKLKQKGTADQVAVWRVPYKLFKTLGKKDVTYKGLSSRDLEIVRDGVKGDTNTVYSVEPADLDAGPTPFTDEDQELSNSKYDLNKLARFVDEEKFRGIMDSKLSGTESDDDDDDDIGAFMKEKPFEEE